MEKATGNDDVSLFDPEAYTAGQEFGERRKLPRAKYEVAATLATGGVEGQEFVVYTRDVNSGGSGFVSPVDVGGVEAALLKVATPDGTVRRVRCHVMRARPIGEGWVEGYVEFDEPTAVFSTKRINAAHADQNRKPVFAGA
jgi:hypothetical protein